MRRGIASPLLPSSVPLGPESDCRGQHRIGISDQLVQSALHGGDQNQLGVALNLAMVEATERLQQRANQPLGAEDDDFDQSICGACGN
eukprot:6273022-Amphidinium_carterae.1